MLQLKDKDINEINAINKVLENKSQDQDLSLILPVSKLVNDRNVTLSVKLRLRPGFSTPLGQGNPEQKEEFSTSSIGDDNVKGGNKNKILLYIKVFWPISKSML